MKKRRGNAWKGGRFVQRNGYVLVWEPDHPNAYSYGYVFEHVRVVASALGRPLCGTEEVHHVDENKSNNANSNLVLCPDRAYHMLLHRRLRAYKAVGDPNARLCKYCKRYDLPQNLKIYAQTQPHHIECNRSWQRSQRRKLAEEA